MKTPHLIPILLLLLAAACKKEIDVGDPSTWPSSTITTKATGYRATFQHPASWFIKGTSINNTNDDYFSAYWECNVRLTKKEITPDAFADILTKSLLAENGFTVAGKEQITLANGTTAIQLNSSATPKGTSWSSHSVIYKLDDTHVVILDESFSTNSAAKNEPILRAITNSVQIKPGGP